MSVLLNLAAVPLSPWLLIQGRRTRRDTPVLPPAGGPSIGIARAANASDAPPHRLIAIGESTVAGVGVGDLRDALGGQFALALSARRNQPILWQAYGWSGATVAAAHANLRAEFAQTHQQQAQDEPPERFSTALIVFGVNDAITFTSPARYTTELAALMETLRRERAVRDFVLVAAPPMERFPALPRPLRDYLGLRTRALNRAARKLASTNVQFIDLALQADPTLFARDGFHPNAAGYAAWGASLAQHLRLPHNDGLTP